MGIASTLPTNFFNFGKVARGKWQSQAVYIWQIGINFAQNKI